jgi:CRISPR/Cas system-associated exonuclease Cas4 (RecB family)
MDRTQYISASEVGDFVYCKRGWWLRMKGLLPTTFAMLQGTQKHESMLLQLLRIKLIQQILMWIGLALLLLLLLLIIFL